MARVAGVDLPREKRGEIAVTYIYGIGKPTAINILKKANVDGNKRVGHAAMETFLVLNGTEIDASIDAQERLMLDLAGGRLNRNELTDWLRHHLKPIG